MINVTGIFRSIIRVAAWATPHYQAWLQRRQFNRSEAFRHLQSRNWPEAESHFLQAIGERHHSPATVLDLVIGLSDARRGLGKLSEAESTCRTAIDMAAASKDPGAQAKARNALLDVELDQQKYNEAEQSVAEIERLERCRPLPDLERIARCTQKLAAAYAKAGRNEEAGVALERASRLCQQVFGPENMETGNSWAALGAFYRRAGNHSAAQRALRLAEQVHGAAAGRDSHEVAQDITELASSLEESGQFDDAATEYARVLALRDRQVGVNHIEKAEIQVRLAALYVKARRTAAARELLIPAIAVLERRPEPSVVTALETMALAEEALGRTDEAVRCRHRAAAIGRP